MSQRRVALKRGGNRLFTFEGSYSKSQKTGNLLELFRAGSEGSYLCSSRSLSFEVESGEGTRSPQPIENSWCVHLVKFLAAE
jgi:hypothetical protein